MHSTHPLRSGCGNTANRPARHSAPRKMLSRGGHAKYCCSRRTIHPSCAKPSDFNSDATDQRSMPAGDDDARRLRLPVDRPDVRIRPGKGSYESASGEHPCRLCRVLARQSREKPQSAPVFAAFRQRNVRRHAGRGRDTKLWLPGTRFLRVRRSEAVSTTQHFSFDAI